MKYENGKILKRKVDKYVPLKEKVLKIEWLWYRRHYVICM
jgi:hypothetical protein